jgi:hypothetical protein
MPQHQHCFLLRGSLKIPTRLPLMTGRRQSGDLLTESVAVCTCNVMSVLLVASL